MSKNQSSSFTYLKIKKIDQAKRGDHDNSASSGSGSAEGDTSG